MMRRDFPQLLFADERGKVYPFEGLEAAGMKAGRFFKLDPAEFLKLPNFSELFMLPGRVPVGLDPQTGRPTPLLSDPYSKEKKKCFAVAAFIPPGHSITYNSAFEEETGAPMLPLFSYAACVYYKNEFYATAIRVDPDVRHEERFMDAGLIEKNIKSYEALFPKNRLVPHLANCATVNACANAKNFFLGRFEAPVPTSPICNAQCQGCISLQPDGRDFPSNQKRIQFVPTPEEIAQLALFHMEKVEEPIVSFGQGCEGEPTLSGEVIEKAIRLIRQKTSKGSINMNSNASRPLTVGKLFDAGLNSIRVSLNSVREPYYSLYYQPKGYSLKTVIESIHAAKARGGFVSLNYLSMPGFTDTREEFEALKEFIRAHKVDMIQWRNLNYDPLHYFKDLGLLGEDFEFLGMRRVLQELKVEFPGLMMGYFNPKKETMRAHSR